VGSVLPHDGADYAGHSVSAFVHACLVSPRFEGMSFSIRLFALVFIDFILFILFLF
jgi:hypothetical protein